MRTRTPELEKGATPSDHFARGRTHLVDVVQERRGDFRVDRERVNRLQSEVNSLTRLRFLLEQGTHQPATHLVARLESSNSSVALTSWGGPAARCADLALAVVGRREERERGREPGVVEGGAWRGLARRELRPCDASTQSA